MIINVSADKIIPTKLTGSDMYVVPSIDVLASHDDESIQRVEVEKFAKEQLETLKTHLGYFNVDATVLGAIVGPVIIRYELELAPGTSISKINKLAGDLSLIFKTPSVRILAPIPGTSKVGIEIPIPKVQKIHIKDILESEAFKSKDNILPIALGKTTDDLPYVLDITNTPHLLIAGQTGSGKSVGLNSILVSLLLTKTPDELRLMLIDPKMVEFAPYTSVPHLLCPVLSDIDEITKGLDWVLEEMDNRYKKFSVLGVRNIESFNDKVPPDLKIPHIVIVIDEFADLMLSSKKTIERAIIRIAQKARSAGIHCIIATQKPIVKVINNIVKSNLPSRIAFRVSSQVDSKIILDRVGAEKLLGNGDMLFKGANSSDPVRVHGCFISDEDTFAIIKECSEQFVKYPRFDFKNHI